MHARDKGVRFNRDNLQFKVNKVKYIGVFIFDKGISPDPDKITAIVEMETPTDAKALHRFIGMVTCLSKFLPNF